MLARDLGKPLPIQRRPSFVSYVRGRTRFFDEVVIEAVRHVPAQVVIVGAGYDDRSFRFRTPGVRFIELDHPVTQADKRRRLDRLGVEVTDIIFVPVDLESAGMDTELHKVLDHQLPTTVICESVLPYLTRPSVERLLRSLSRTPGSPVQLALDPPVVPSNLAGRVAFASFRLYGSLAGERVRTALAPGTVPRFLEDAGWTVRRWIRGSELGMPRSRAQTLFVVATPLRADTGS